MIALPPEFATTILYNDLEEDQAKHWTSLVKPQSAGYAMLPKDNEVYV